MDDRKKNDDTLGVVFKDKNGEKHQKLDMETPLKGGGSVRGASLLSTGEGVFDVGHAFGSTDDVERGTIVTDKRHVHVSIGETLRSAFSEWYEKTAASLRRVEVLQKNPPVTVAAPETRREVIKEASGFTKQVPKDDHTIIVEKLKTLNRDAARVTGRPFSLKSAGENSPPPQSTPVGTPEKSTPDADFTKNKSTLDLRAHAIAPTVEKKFSAPSHEHPHREEIPASGIPLFKTIPRDALPHHEDRGATPPQPILNGHPNQVPEIVHRDPASFKKEGSEPGWSFLLNETEDSPKLANVSFPEWDVEKHITEVLSNPAPDPKDVERIGSKRKEVESAQKEAALRVLKERAAEEVARQEEAARVRKEEAERARKEELARVQRIEAESRAAREAEIQKQKHAEEPAALALRQQRADVETIQHTSIRTATIPREKAGKFPFATAIIIALVIVGTVAGVGAAFMVTKESPQEAAVPTPTLVSADATVEAQFSADRTTLIASLERAVGDSLGEITHIAIRDESGLLVNPETFFSSLGAGVPGSFVRSLRDTMMVGSVSLTKHELFIIFQTNSFESAFAGMLAWEPRMRSDFAPLFGKTSDMITDSIESRFADATTAGDSIRILRGTDGQEVLLYAFVNRTTLIITSSTEALAMILPKLK